MTLVLLTPLALGLFVSPRPAPQPVSTRAAQVCLCADADLAEARVREAADRVLAAAAQFGEAQVAAADEWVEEALASRSRETDPADLMEKQLALFEDCLVEESFKCAELDRALTTLEKTLKQGQLGPMDAFAGFFRQGKLDRACARVRCAASKYGAAQSKIAESWLAELRGSKDAMNPFELLEQQELLFGECLIDYDGSGPEKCQELEEALGALQLSLGVRGAVVSTRAILGAPAVQ